MENSRQARSQTRDAVLVNVIEAKNHVVASALIFENAEGLDPLVPDRLGLRVEPHGPMEPGGMLVNTYEGHAFVGVLAMQCAHAVHARWWS